MVEHCVVGQGQQPMRRLPVRRGGSLPEGAELNTTLALRVELDDVAGAEFNSQKAVQEQLQKSARTKNSISAWATEAVNVPPSQHLYRALVSVNVEEEELISQALRDWLQPWQQERGEKPLLPGEEPTARTHNLRPLPQTHMLGGWTLTHNLSL